MAKIYHLEKVEPQRTVQTQQGSFTSQKLLLRELEGGSKYDQRYSVEYIGGADLAQYQGKFIATHLTMRTTESGATNYSNWICREVFAL